MSPQPHPARERAGDLFKTQAFVGGQWLDSPQRFAVTDPATGEQLAEVSNLDANAALGAIEAANAALASWRDRPARERSQIMRRWFELIVEHADAIAALLTAEQGKPLAEAKAEVLYGASFIEWFAEEARRIQGDVTPTPGNDRRILVIKQATGVCAAITPWNFPVAMVTRKVAPALAAGCTIVLKPAEQTPLCALALAELSQRAGIPAGVFNVLSCDAQNAIDIGKALCASPVVRHLSFTGSTEVGRILMAQCAPTVKKLALELGGHAPFIVFDDADLDAAVEGAMLSKYRNAGQTCVCTNRFIVQSGIHDAFVERLVARTRELKLGNGFEAGVQQGPLIDDAGVAKVMRHIDDARAKGAQVLTGGTPPQGRFVTPTVLRDVTQDMLIAREETFGPVSAVMKFATDEEAIALANASEFGLAAYFYSRDIGRVWRVAEALEYGMVGINTGAISYETVPFGGIKQSGFGREGSHYGIEEYVEMKYLCMAGL
ncbi:NAD-dependent succinate-semialdehyde dehydrogenase [Uliginosibacterium sp. H3]|uniref:NAD-dependent succinate-semialdehyde dehydrogenase n=1 Tax=Uliginosibacterium silvisoli TaxID=3114758 RepID=A0ABU6K5C5_9RHOO|nr:NAD-dependent succinate-semialdehyde dehydrogenase [Uliginosibacterium sp. H3]